MSKPWYKGKSATQVYASGVGTVCVYHQTEVVYWSSEEIVLNSGGYRTYSTKDRMNEVSHEYKLGYSVFQKNKEWFVSVPGNDGPVPFKDGMRLLRQGSKLTVA